MKKVEEKKQMLKLKEEIEKRKKIKKQTKKKENVIIPNMSKMTKTK